jgi:hypothetical protein
MYDVSVYMVSRSCARRCKVALRGGINFFNMPAVGTKVEHQNKQNIYIIAYLADQWLLIKTVSHGTLSCTLTMSLLCVDLLMLDQC